uniref:C-terminal processing peptidase n=1 Tax=Fagus sylvatica TaxID=28930 RepID=A0A2N9F3Q2_FAGSY
MELLASSSTASLSPHFAISSIYKNHNCIAKVATLQHVSVHFVRLLVGVMLVMSLSVAVSKSPSWALTEENLLFLEAWRTIDRAYIDKTFNGQSWFRYRENALRNEPMNTREQTYMAIRKMLATLDDPFTRFLEPEKFKSLRSGTQGALTGVGLSIGYPTQFDGSPAGLVVISAAPGGPANRAGILSGDVILAIDDTSTKTMGIYDAAERLHVSLTESFLELYWIASNPDAGVFKRGEADAICWDSSSRKVFEVKSFYKALFMTACQVFPLRSVWKPKVPTKVSFLLWTTVLGKVLTMDNLRKCGLVVIDWCCMCKRAEEITDHLLLHCLMA